MDNDNMNETPLFYELQKVVTEAIEKYLKEHGINNDKDEEYPEYYRDIMHVGQYLTDIYDDVR